MYIYFNIIKVCGVCRAVNNPKRNMTASKINPFSDADSKKWLQQLHC